MYLPHNRNAGWSVGADQGDEQIAKEP